jgi:hypothetical protein
VLAPGHFEVAGNLSLSFSLSLSHTHTRTTDSRCHCFLLGLFEVAGKPSKYKAFGSAADNSLGFFFLEFRVWRLGARG